MDRRTCLKLALAFCLPGGGAFAETPAEAIERQLRTRGYKSIEVSRTWLGRTRIVARKSDVVREIIVNPRTGEILRDFWQGNGAGLLDSHDDDDDGGGKGRGRGRGEDSGQGRGRGRGGDDSGGGHSGGGDDSGGDDSGGGDSDGGGSGESGDGDD